MSLHWTERLKSKCSAENNQLNNYYHTCKINKLLRKLHIQKSSWTLQWCAAQKVFQKNQKLFFLNQNNGNVIKTMVMQLSFKILRVSSICYLFTTHRRYRNKILTRCIEIKWFLIIKIANALAKTMILARGWAKLSTSQICGAALVFENRCIVGMKKER